MMHDKTNEIIITRIFDAPHELVWKAFTVPEHMMRWWGPKHFTAPVCQVDLRIGGKYLCCIHSEEGKDYWTTGVYKEIIPMEKLVCTDCFADKNGNVVPASYYEMLGDNWPLEMLVTFFFEDMGNKTKLTLRHFGHPAGEMGKMATQGWNESLDKLAESLKHDRRKL